MKTTHPKSKIQNKRDLHMNNRNTILGVILVLQLALAAFLLWPRSASIAAASLINNVQLEEVNKVMISEGSKTIQLAKSGDKWVLPERGDFEVLAPSVTDLISKVLQINTSRLVASNAANFAQLKVADNDFNKKIDIATSGGQNVSLLIGTSPNTRATNVRTAGDNNVYITDKVAGADVRTDYATYVNTSYFNADADRISVLAFTNITGTLEGSKDLSGTWQLSGLQSGESFSNTTFASLATKFTNLSFTEPVGKDLKPEYGFDKPQATITITVRPAADVTDTTAAPEVTTFIVGAKDESGGAYYVKSSKSDYYVKVNGFTLQDFVQKKREDYVLAAAPAAITVGEGFTNTLASPAASPVTGTVDLSQTTPISDSGAVNATEVVSP